MKARQTISGLHTAAERRTGARRRAGERRHRRRGIETVEVLLAFPVLYVGTLAVFQFGILIIVNQAVWMAATEGARVAAQTTDDDEVADTVGEFLGVHEISLTPGGNARLIIERGGDPPVNRGNTGIDCVPSGPDPQADEVRVTVCVEMTNADDQPVPNWLSSFGFSLSGRRFEVSALAKVE